MKSFYLLPLIFFTTVICDKKINLEDIERDQLRSLHVNGDKKSEPLHAEESKYSEKPEVNSQSQQNYQQQQQQSQQYHGPTTPPQELGNQAGDYAELPAYESFKYSLYQQDYNQEKYPANDDGYLQQSGLLATPSVQQQHQHQYYTQDSQSNSQNDYNTLQDNQQQQTQQRQPLYNQEVLVGNQLQTVQQKAATQKYADANGDKGSYFVNVPTSQLFAYYQNYGISQSKGKNIEQQISLPAYTSLLTHNQVYSPAKVTYQPEVQYVPTYQKHTQATYQKASKGKAISAGTIHASPAAISSASAHQLPSASNQQYANPLDILTNGAYAASIYQPQKYQYYVTPQYEQQQTHYMPEQQQHQRQQIIYENTVANAYPDIYNAQSASFVQDNSLYEQPHQQQYYVPTALAEQLMAQIFRQAGIHDTVDTPQQDVKQEPEPLINDFVPPQYQAQKFRDSHEVTHLVPVSAESDGFSSKPVYSSETSSTTSSSHQPKTLLDSYVPSHVIAAQDANRYRERPIKLESGFLPSKINFVRSHKKRKTE